MSSPSAPPSALAAAALTKVFGKRAVLDGVSLSVASGEVHAVLGPSGAGKSTLLRVMNLLEPPTSGSVTLDGADVALTSRTQRLAGAQRHARLAMALVPQKPVAFRASVFDNAAYGLRLRGLPESEVESRVGPALDKLGIGALADQRAWNLSGGETQRLAFARAAVLPLRYLLLDEFTANLDVANVRALENAVLEVAHEQGVGVLLVTHDLFQAKRLADRVSLMIDGRIIESAPREAFFGAPEDPHTRSFLDGGLAY